MFAKTFAKKVYRLIIFIVILIFLFSFFAYFLFFTTKGSAFLTKKVISKYVDSDRIDIKKIDGTLSRTLIFQDIEIKDLEGLPQGSLIKIQELEVNFMPFNREKLNLEIHNGRLKMPASEPILFYGSYQNGSLDINVYSKYVDVRDTLDLFAEGTALKKISGTIGDLDVYIKGSFIEPKLNGKFEIKRLTRNGFSIVDCPGLFDIILKDIKGELKAYGEIVLKSGIVSGPKTAVIKLQQSKILFDGDTKKPRLDFKGSSTVENTKINIVLKGTFDAPDLKLSSEPPVPQEWLLVMLATGKSWKGVEGALSKGELSADLAKDFIDYFIFSGSGGKIAKKFGISDISLKLDSATKGVKIKKELSDKSELTYGVEQLQTKEEKPTTTHQVGGEYKITESISVGGEKELRQDDKTEQTQDKTKTNDKIFLKYKKEF
ncbi:MAG: hypothetical protein AMJ78_08970 [Omnitrophica WOR_2 bacterium SM23_29]|nr:MAG: hypothetical protein AMJ78_08970 [Omnitrophica WOR_2 bacterium SM23_29]